MQDTSIKLSFTAENETHTALIKFNREPLVADTPVAGAISRLNNYLYVSNHYPMFNVVLETFHNLISTTDFSLPHNAHSAAALVDVLYTLGHNHLLVMPYLVKLLSETFANVLPQNNFVLAQTLILFMQNKERFADRVGFDDLQEWEMRMRQIPEVAAYLEAVLAVEN